LKRGFNPRVGEIYETILSTYNDDGRPNAAPMGIIFTKRKKVCMRLYRGSQTLVNILARKCAVANITSDPILFYKTALKEETRSPTRSYSKAEMVNAPLLKDADGYLEMRLIRSIPGKEKIDVEFCVKKFSRRKVTARFHSRAAHALIESTIHATRVREYLSKGNRRKATPLIRMINHYKDVIERVSPDSDYASAIKELQSSIHRWKRRSIRQNAF